ncbi:MAG: hypothetical protein ACYS26_22375, partial [Planctomycetota bacterium]
AEDRDAYEVRVDSEADVEALSRALHLAATELGAAASRSVLERAPAKRAANEGTGALPHCIWLTGSGAEEHQHTQWKRWVAANRARNGKRAKLFFLRISSERSAEPAQGVHPAPACDGVALGAWVHESFDGSRTALDRLARGLATQAGGSPGKTAGLLEQLVANGWLLPTDRRWRLAQCQLPLPEANAAESTPSAEAARLWCRLHLLGPAASEGPWWSASDLVGLDLASAWRELESLRALGGALHAIEWVAEPPADLSATWESELLSLRGQAREESTLADCLGGEDAVRPALERLAELRSAGLPAEALERVEHAASLHAYAERSIPAWLAIERALCLAQLGQAPAALEILDALPSNEGAAPKARLARAWVHLAQGAAAAARTALEGAESDAEQDPEVCAIAMRLELEQGRPRAAVELAAQSPIDPSDPTRWRTACNVARLEALAHAALGEPERAATQLRSWLAQAGARGDVAARAVLLSNLATALRAAGRTRSAVGCLRRAARLAEAGNQVAAESTARSQLGALLRERGRRGAARDALDRALELKHFLGDERGAFDVQALRALCESEGGHLERARVELEELRRTALERKYGATADRLGARLALVRARLGLPADEDLEVQGDGEAPHAWIDLARANTLRDGASSLEALRERRRLAEDQGRGHAAWGLGLIESQVEREACALPP